MDTTRKQRPQHCRRVCKAWKHENEIVRVEWPSQSLDANPIENVWVIVKHKLGGNRVITPKSTNAHNVVVTLAI